MSKPHIHRGNSFHPPETKELQFCGEGVSRSIARNTTPIKKSLKKKIGANPNNSFVLDSEKCVSRKIITEPRTLEKGAISTVPRKIDAREFNIFHIDSIIVDTITQNINTVPDLQRDLDKAIWVSTHSKNGDHVAARIMSNTLRKKIRDLESTFELAYYMLRTNELLAQYKKLMLTENSRSFVCINKDIGDKEAFQRNEIVMKYLLIAREYVEIENYHQAPHKLVCPACNSSDMRRANEEDTTFVCSACCTEVEISDDAPSFKDTDRVNMCRRYTYSRKGHFIEAIRKHQGKQNTDPDEIQQVVAILQREMEFHNLTPLTVEKDQLYMFLTERKLSLHYDDINLLYHIITDKPCPDISMYEAAILEDFDEQEKALNMVTQGDDVDVRVNSLNVYYKLYKLLQRHGFRCRKDDFYILKTPSKEDEHDEKMREAWNSLGWDWIETF